MAKSHTGKDGRNIDILYSSHFCFFQLLLFLVKSPLPKTYLHYILYANNFQTSFFQIDAINKKTSINLFKKRKEGTELCIELIPSSPAVTPLPENGCCEAMSPPCLRVWLSQSSKQRRAREIPKEVTWAEHPTSSCPVFCMYIHKRWNTQLANWGHCLKTGIGKESH